METGICSLSNVPIRKDASSQSEIVSMVLFGETFLIEEEQNGWTKVTTHFDHYQGWISTNQVTVLSVKPLTFTTVTQYPFAILQSASGIIMAPCGSQLPDYKNESCNINNHKYSVSHEQSNFNAENLLTLATQYVNAPYLWGGRIPFGIDCSGLTQAVYKCIGIPLKRDAYQQADMGTTVSFLEEVERGDLAFFDNAEGKITHVGMMLDKHRIIHASGKVRVDNIDSYGILNAEDRNYSHTLRIIKRIL